MLGSWTSDLSGLADQFYAAEPVPLLVFPAGSARVRTTSWAPEGAGIAKRALARHWTSIAAAGNRLRGRR